MLKRRRVTIEQAVQAIEIYQQIPLNFLIVDLVDAVKLASRLDIYADDAYIIACALKQNYALMSLDAGLIRAAKARGVSVLEVS